MSPPGFPGFERVYSLSIPDDGTQLLVGDQDADRLIAIRRDVVTGRLSPIDDTFSGCIPELLGRDGVCGITSVAASGRFAYTAGPHAIGVFERDLGTRQIDQVQVVQTETAGVAGIDDVRSIDVSPDGDHLYVVDRDGDVFVFRRARASGALEFVESQANTTTFEWADSLLLSPDGKFLYVLHKNGIRRYDRNAAAGTLGGQTFFPVAFDLFQFNSRGSFARSERAIGQMYVTLQDRDGILQFTRDGTGAIGVPLAYVNGVGPIRGLDGPRAATLSPDGENLYVAGYEDAGVAVFARNQATGILSFVENQPIDLQNPDFSEAWSVAVAPDGGFVYALSFYELAVFARSEFDGSLDFVAAYDTCPGYDDLELGGQWLTTSTNGGYVFATLNGRSFLADTVVAVFAQDADSGELDCVEVKRALEGRPPSTGISGSESIARDPDGKNVYVGNHDGIAVFRVNVSTAGRSDQRHPRHGRN